MCSISGCVDLICCPICCPLKTCYYICCFVTIAILVTVGVLIAFLVQKPSASLTSFTLQCSTQPQCLSLATTTGIPATAIITVHNPNIISGNVYSEDLTLTDPSNSAVVGTGYFNSVHVGSRTDTDITAYFLLAASAETVKIATALYRGQSYQIHINGDLHISVGAISFTYTLSDDGTIPAQS